MPKFDEITAGRKYCVWVLSNYSYLSVNEEIFNKPSYDFAQFFFTSS